MILAQNPALERLKIECWDDDQDNVIFSKDPDSMGHAFIQMKKMYPSGLRNEEFELIGEESGTVKVDFFWTTLVSFFLPQDRSNCRHMVVSVNIESIENGNEERSPLFSKHVKINMNDEVSRPIWYEQLSTLNQNFYCIRSPQAAISVPFTVSVNSKKVATAVYETCNIDPSVQFSERTSLKLQYEDSYVGAPILSAKLQIRVKYAVGKLVFPDDDRITSMTSEIFQSCTSFGMHDQIQFQYPV